MALLKELLKPEHAITLIVGFSLLDELRVGGRMVYPVALANRENVHNIRKRIHVQTVYEKI